MPLREQLLGVAQLGVEKLGETIEHASSVADKQFIVDSTNSILDRLGYSPRSATPNQAPAQGNNIQQNNFYVVDKEALSNAREKMRSILKEPTTIEGDVSEQRTEGTSSEEI